MNQKPALSIITINFNNASGLDLTMKSVFSQTFQDYEYIIIDGGSTDGSVDVIQKYLSKPENAEKVTYWVSEKDKGIYNAMNKGIKKQTVTFSIFLTVVITSSMKTFWKNFQRNIISQGQIQFIMDIPKIG